MHIRESVVQISKTYPVGYAGYNWSFGVDATTNTSNLISLHVSFDTNHFSIPGYFHSYLQFSFL